MTKVAVIGSGFSSLSTACYLAKQGLEVEIFEKNASLGGRARVLEKEGFRFDMGPSWYWMPDVFERFFGDFDKKPADYYDLIRLSPAYRVYFGKGDFIEIPDTQEEIYKVFEQEERGSALALEKFLDNAAYNYKVAINDIVYKPGLSPLELVTPQTVSKLGQFFTNIRSDIRRRFKSDKLRKILEFPVLFLGAKPQDTPAFYNFMNYADFALGTWYPDKGMYSVVEAMVSLADELGVKFHLNHPIEKIEVVGDEVKGIWSMGNFLPFDKVVSGADYSHTESLLPVHYQVYGNKYWEKKIFAPSALLFYVGFDCQIEGVPHHTLFFDEEFDEHAKDIYDHPNWPKSPLFYASFTSKTDATVAPVGKENAVFLIPVAPGLEDSPELHEQYFKKIISRLEKHTGASLSNKVIVKASFGVSDFKKDYNAFKGNAYGMANTLLQTAYFRPSIKSKKVKGLYFTGQLTVPGPGVPPALISGKIAAHQLIKELKSTNYEKAVV